MISVSPGNEAALMWPGELKVHQSRSLSQLLQLSQKRAQRGDKHGYS